MITWASIQSRFAWIAQSRKAQVAIGSIVFVLLTKWLPKLGFTTAECSDITTAIKTVCSVWIAAIAVEDAATKSNPPTL